MLYNNLECYPFIKEKPAWWVGFSVAAQSISDGSGAAYMVPV
jgi:hypothetical protein